MATPNPQRGEVWWVDLGYVGKVRPCLVLSVPFEDHERAVATCVICTMQVRGTRFEVEATARFLKDGGVFDPQGLVSPATTKFRTKLGRLPKDHLVEVEDAVKRWLGFVGLDGPVHRSS